MGSTKSVSEAHTDGHMDRRMDNRYYQVPTGVAGGQCPDAGGKRRLIRGMGSTTWISNGTRPQDPGGGEVQLAASRDVAVARPVLQPTSQPASVMVVMEELQRDVWTELSKNSTGLSHM